MQWYILVAGTRKVSSGSTQHCLVNTALCSQTWRIDWTRSKSLWLFILDSKRRHRRKRSWRRKILKWHKLPVLKLTKSVNSIQSFERCTNQLKTSWQSQRCLWYDKTRTIKLSTTTRPRICTWHCLRHSASLAYALLICITSRVFWRTEG